MSLWFWAYRERSRWIPDEIAIAPLGRSIDSVVIKYRNSSQGMFLSTVRYWARSRDERRRQALRIPFDLTPTTPRVTAARELQSGHRGRDSQMSGPQRPYSLRIRGSRAGRAIWPGGLCRAHRLTRCANDVMKPSVTTDELIRDHYRCLTNDT